MTHTISLAVDFDGVIHKYTSPWTHAEEISDGPVEGAIDWIRLMLSQNVKIQIFTARLSGAPIGDEAPRDPYAIRAALVQWFVTHGLPENDVASLYFVRGKPHATLYIDDRAQCFRGRFPSVDDIRGHRQRNKSKPADMLSDDAWDAILAARARGLAWDVIERQLLDLVTSARHLEEKRAG